MSSENNIPPAPYPSQVEEWQVGGDDQLANHEVDSLPNTDDGGATLSDGDLENGENRNLETGTRASKRSKRSSNKTPSRVDSGSVIWTRAPPKKSYEPDPFLSIDNLPMEKKKQFVAQQKRSTRTVSRGPKVPFNSPAPNNASRVASSHMSSRPSTGSGWNRLVPKHPKYLHPNSLQGPASAPNHMLKAPFKQSLASRGTALNKDEVSPRPLSPGLAMKEKTAMATYHVARTIAKQKPASDTVISGRLLKAKLKPISTVAVEGPSITNCRGIVAGDRSKKDNLTSIDEADGEGRWALFAYYNQHKESAAYAMARSRTLQRRRHILHTVGTAPIRQHRTDTDNAAAAAAGDRPGTSESVHQTSIASDMSQDDAERLDELNAELQQLERNAQEALAAATETDEFIVEDDPPSLAYPQVPTNSEVFLTEEKEDAETIETAGTTEAKMVNANTDAVDPSLSASKMAASGVSRVSSGKSKPGSAKSCLVDPGSRPQTEGSQRKVRFSASSTASRARSVVPEYSLEISKETEDEDKTLALVRHEYSQGDYNDENANNSNNTGRNEPLRMSVNDMKFGFERPEDARTVRTAQKIRPTSAHKTWEDLQKPDSNVSDLSISGKHQAVGDEEDDDEDECKISVQVTRKNRANSAKSRRGNSAAARVYARGSPRGTKPLGPKEFMAIERQREIERTRPQSAMVVYDPIEVEPQPKALAPRPTTPKGSVGLGGKRRVLSSSAQGLRQQQQRPNSSVKRAKKPPGNTATRSQKRCSSAHTYDPRIPVLVQCCVCVRKLKKYLSEEEANNKDKFMCKDCQTFKGIVAEYNAIAAPKNKQQQEDDDDEPQLAIEYSPDAINEDELGIIDDDVASDEEEQGFELLTNMDDIEQSLTQIRGQIKESQAKYKQKKEEEEKRVRFEDDDDTNNNDDVFLTEASKLVESTISSAIKEEESHREEVQLAGEMSSMLLDCKELPPQTPAVKPLLNHMQVYHMDQDDGDNTTHISTFPMSVMDEEGQGHSQGFLEMLMEELPEEEPQTSAPIKTTSSPPLEVKAQPARMSAAKNGVTMPSSIAPFSPLCFKINARPPAGYLYYFAYGIDMNPNRFATYIGRQQAERSWGLMMGFRLAFNRKAEDAGCFPNVEPNACSSVEGCLYLITPAELHRLNNHMGCPQKLQQVMLPVWLLNCDSPSELGVMQYCVPALLYVATDAAVHPAASEVDSSYAVEQCVKGGGDVLSPAYVEHLQDMKPHTPEHS